MQVEALATDYDGTIARDGVVDADTVTALERLKDSGCRLIMVTGRELDDLIAVCPHLHLFDLVIAENGAVLFDPATKAEDILSGGPSDELVARLRQAGINDISVGRSIIATWKPHETAALEAIRDLGLDLHIVFNKEAVMILPTSVNKATGLKVGLKRLGLQAENVAGIGDAENDLAFLRFCGLGIAVANAIPSVKQQADFTTTGERGAGAIELIERILANDLPVAKPRPAQVVPS